MKPKYIKTPEKMWELFTAYKKDVKDNPRSINVFGGKDFEEKKNKLERPLTISGFRVYCYDKDITIHHYFTNTDKAYDAYRSICMRIKDCIRQDQIEGGSVGQYNASITQRLNNLTEKTETKTETKDTSHTTNWST